MRVARPGGSRSSGVVVLLVAAILASGCGSPPAEPVVEPPPPPTLPQFEAPRLVGGGGELEVSILVTDEVELVCQMGAGERDVLHASFNGGLRWEEVPIDRSPRASTDCDMAIGSAGTWYVVFLDTAGEQTFTGNSVTDGLLTFGSSSDQGQTWTWTTLPGFVNGLVDRPWIRVVGDQTIYLTHKSANLLPFSVWFQRSDDGGATWTDPLLITRSPEPQAPNGNVGKMVVGEDGRSLRLPLHLFDTRAGEGRDEWLALAVSDDAGASWTVQPVVGPVQTRADYFLPTLGQADNGTLYVAVPLANGTTGADVSVVVSADGGTSWSEPVILEAGAEFQDAQASLALDAGPDGTMDAAWYQWRAGWVVSLARLRGEDVMWSRELNAPQGTSFPLEFLGLDHDAAGRAHVAYPVPEDPCPDGGGRDCIYLVVER